MKIKPAVLLSTVTLIVFAFLAIASGSEEKKNITSSENGGSSATSQESEKSTVAVGQVLHTEYFDVTVNHIKVTDRVSTGNEFSDLKPEAGIKYLIINATFKNTDKESRMVMDGSVWVNYQGKEYEYDNSETIMADGWGTAMDQINPLTSKTTNIVYKIPAELQGTAQWQPGRSEREQVINLGEIK